MRFVRLAATVIAIVLAGTGAALAHAKLRSSVPQDGATVAAGLSEIEVAFSHPMRLTLVRLHRAADDTDVPLAGALPKGVAESAKVAVGALEPGAYSVSWTAVAEDGHVMKGHFAFTVAPAQ
jgi:methionine-rich copper-binding protein CopC